MKPPSPLDALHSQSLDCVHCGLCLTACPTYLETGRETSSPRGRVYLMRGVAEGEIPLSAAVSDELHLCLGCRACETACPSGVRYGAMLEQARAQVAEVGLRRSLAARLERLGLRRLVPRPRALHAFVSMLALVQRLSLDRLAARLLPAALGDVTALLPPVPPAARRGPLPPFTPARGKRRGRVAFFAGCIMPELFGDVNRATIEVLAENGFDVEVPAGQGCCGALQAHAGLLDLAHDLVARNRAPFARVLDGPGEPVAAIVMNSAGCGAWLREQPGAGLGAPIRDVCEFLDDAGLRRPGGRIDARLCYDDPCHLIHGQGVSAAPRRVLESIEGLVLVPHRDASACCGAAGTYNLTQPSMSRRILAAKLESLQAARPRIVATGNPGCLMQLRAGLAECAPEVRVAHPVELLAEAYAGSGDRSPAGSA